MVGHTQQGVVHVDHIALHVNRNDLPGAVADKFEAYAIT